MAVQHEGERVLKVQAGGWEGMLLTCCSRCSRSWQVCRGTKS